MRQSLRLRTGYPEDISLFIRADVRPARKAHHFLFPPKESFKFTSPSRLFTSVPAREIPVPAVQNEIVVALPCGFPQSLFRRMLRGHFHPFPSFKVPLLRIFTIRYFAVFVKLRRSQLAAADLRPSVTSSAYSKLLPTGRPHRRRVAFTPRGFTSRAIHRPSPRHSTVGFVAIISFTSPLCRASSAL